MSKNAQYKTERVAEENLQDTDKFLQHLNDVINADGYNSSSDDDLQNDNKVLEHYTNDDEQMQEIFDVLRLCNEKSTKKNKTFSSEKLREIDRNNAILMKKIVSHNHRQSQYGISSPSKQPQTSAAINRRRQQKKIERENMVNIYSITISF